MAKLHIAQIGDVSEQHAMIGMQQPSWTRFNPDVGRNRAEILVEILSKLLAARNNGRLMAAELGVHTGSLSEELLHSVPALELLMVDPWEYASEDFFAHEGASWSKDAREHRRQASEKVQRFSNRSIIVQQKSSDAAAWIGDETLD